MEEDLQENYGIECPTSMKITQVEDEMYRSNMFSKEELMAWEEKNRADKTWVHLRTYFKDRWTTTMRYQGDTPHKHVFESAASAEEDRGEQRLANNLRKVSVAATADKEHIQKMTTQNYDLLKVVRKHQEKIDKQQTHIDELLKQNGQLINKIGTNTNTGGATSAGAEIPTVVGIEATVITTATATPTTMTRDRTMWLPPTTEPTISLSTPCVPFDRMQQLIVGSWIKTKAKDLIIGQLCSNETCRGQVTIKSRG